MPSNQASFLPSVPAEDAPTPVMAQYLALKDAHKDCLLFFRLGDFYEMFFDDAITAAQVLDIALTRRGQMNGADVPMCGIPVHAYENYVARLIRAGHRVAVAEQMESPSESKKRGSKSIVERQITRIITPGTITEDSLLDARASNHLVCLVSVGQSLSLAWMDLGQAQPYVQSVTVGELGGILARLAPSEIILADKLAGEAVVGEILTPWRDALTVMPTTRFDSDNAQRRIGAIYAVHDVASLGDLTRGEIASLGALLDYISLTQKKEIAHFARPQKMTSAQVMMIDAGTRRNLELTHTLAGEKKGSLLSVIDRAMTGAGARMLASRLTSPLLDVDCLNARFDAVDFMMRHDALRVGIRALLGKTPDIERAVTRLGLGRGGPRDLAGLRDALKCAGDMRSELLAMGALPRDVAGYVQQLESYDALIEKLSAALADDLPLLPRDGGFVARGYSHQLDELLVHRDDSRRLIASLQDRYVRQTGAPNLKIKHNNILGYFIEVSPNTADKILAQKDTFIHRQSLSTAIRFTTVELGELEQKMMSANDKALVIELGIFDDLVAGIMARADDLRKTAQAIASVDVCAGLAELALQENYVRPILKNNKDFRIQQGRHPVVEQALKREGKNFIANDCDLNAGGQIWLLTGPNMAGKSTFLRQNALIAIMAQMGSFVPAQSAEIGIIDRLFSRVGAADDLARGHSTFMVEMLETALILNDARANSFVILDEIGRGTATYDGLSIAWAVLEHLHEVLGARALFATHYHELTALQKKLKNLACYTMQIKEWKNEIIFMHSVMAGIADRSYGIHVAQMAGMPGAVIARAGEVLNALENKDGASASDAMSALPDFKPQARAKIKPMPVELEKLLSELNPDEMTPKTALDFLYRIKKAAE